MVITPRDVLEKSFFFNASQAIAGLSDQELQIEMGMGTQEDFYCWVSSAPDEFCKPTSARVRSCRLLGFNMVGKCENLPEHRRKSSGCYLHNLIANDIKIGFWQ